MVNKLCITTTSLCDPESFNLSGCWFLGISTSMVSNH